MAASASEVNKALSGLYGHVRRLERDEPEPGETREAALRAQAEIWDLLRDMRTMMRRDLGVTSAPLLAQPSGRTRAVR
ncbi:hypothetical protein SLA_7297 [Streptomyces laurentii]|uniref:Uncharacterized protein n=1 Tax=Streptomyces laurentii TaxID=39478 RepID=A0A169PLG2_STRLU|nr:hypothetical protein SLA_7297 [Streptomyces laurentii]